MANPVILVTLLNPGSITASGTYDVSVTATGSVNVIGSGSPPIDVVLSSVAAGGLATTYNITNANVQLSGVASVAAFTTYNIGSNGTLEVNTTVGLPVGTAVNFTGNTGHLVVDGLSIPVLGSISGFGPGKTIDIASIALDHVSYAGNPLANTGGTLTLYGANNTQLGTVNLATGTYVTKNFGLLADGGHGTLLQFDSFVTGLTATPTTADLGPNATVGFSVAISNPVTVTGGPPTLTLDDGGTAIYDAANSTSTLLKFIYTVGAGQNSPDLNVTGIVLNGATMATIGGGGVQLSTFVGNPAGTLVIDTTPPTVTSITASNPNTILAAGGTVAFTVATSETVALAGAAPTLTLSDGGTAVFDSGSSSSNSLVFRYTVLSGQNSSDLAINAINLNAGTIADLAGNALVLPSSVTNPAGTLVVDTTPPAVIAVTVTSPNAILTTGGTAFFNVAISEPIAITGGTPTLTLSDGGIATLDSSSTPTNLVFRYTVLSGQNSSDLGIVSVNLNSAWIADPAGNTLVMTGIVGNPLGTLVIDTTPPTVTSITASTPDGILAAGRTVAFNVATSEPIVLAGSRPTLTLSDGGTAYYDSSTSIPSNLVFRYTVMSGENSPDLAVNAINLNTGTIADLAGNAFILPSSPVNPAGTLVIDTTAPTITSVSVSPNAGDLGAGQIVTINIALSKGVIPTGSGPTLTLNDGGTATFDAASSTNTNLVFRQTIMSGQNASNLAITGISGTGFTDLAGNPLNLAPAAANPFGIVVDTLAPTINSVTTNPGAGNLKAGQTVTFDVATSEAVLLAGGTPTLTLNDGGTATFDRTNSNGTNLIFTHTIQAGQNATDLAVTGITVGGPGFTDGAGNPLALAAVIGNLSGTLVVDTRAPTVTGVTTNPGSGALDAGRTVTFDVALSEPVILTGSPTLSLSDGGSAIYDSTNSTRTNLFFTYVVQPNRNAADLTVTSANLTGVTIVDPAGNAADLTGVVNHPAGIITIDTTAPAITAVTTNPTSGTLVVGQTLTLSVALTEPVLLAGGVPTLTLSDGGTATYDAAHSTRTNLVFTHIVQAGQNASALTVTNVNLNGAIIADPAGNPLTLSATSLSPPGLLTVDSTFPAVASVTTNSASSDLTVGATVTITLGLTAAVSLTGSLPTLTLNDGGTATYVSNASTPTSLVFTHTVQLGQNSADLQVTAVNFNNGSIADGSSRTLNVDGALLNPPGTLIIDTLAPTIRSVTTNPVNGSVMAGQTVTFHVVTSEPVQLLSGIPALALNDGGTATYDAVQSTPSNLVFTYTVATNENVANLTATALAGTGPGFIDPAGNVLNLATALNTPTGLTVDTIAPNITTITTNPASGSVGPGQTVTFSIATSEPVSLLSGTPALTLNDGGTATYDAIHSTPTNLVFTYTVGTNENVANLAATALAGTGPGFTDPAGNALNLATALNTPTGLTVDTIAPTITTITTNPASGSVGPGQTVTFSIATSEPVSLLSGTPALTLNDGGTATYDAIHSTPTNLVFTYTVTAGQNVANLAATALAGTGSGFTDPAGNALNLAAVAAGTPTGLSVDTIAPNITAVTTNPGSGSVSAGQTVTFDVALSEGVTIAGGIPTLTLSDGGTATYDAIHSTATDLVFTHTIQPGQNTSNLVITAATIAGAVIADGAGNLLDLSGAIRSPAGTLVVDTASTPTTGTTPPTVLTVTTTPSAGSVSPGQAVSFIITTDNPVAIAGGIPTLALSDGGFATYDAANSTPTHLVFDSIIQPGQLSDDLAIVGYDLHGAAITDSTGSPLSLAAAQVNPPGQLSVTNGNTPTTSTNPTTTATPTTSITSTVPTPSTTQPDPTTPTTNGVNAPVSDTLPVYRFFDSTTGTHFYTSSASERQTILSTRPDLVSEGVGLRAVDPASGDTSAIEVFRFFDTVHGTQFLTANTGERDDIIASRPDLTFEPNGSFFEHVQPKAGDTPVYRFFSSSDGTHFYTDSAAERSTILQTRPDLIAEGVGFYEPS